jgi:hypothetical protein
MNQAGRSFAVFSVRMYYDYAFVAGLPFDADHVRARQNQSRCNVEASAVVTAQDSYGAANEEL